MGDAYLVARAREDCLDADELLVQRHSAMAYRVALRLTGDHHDAQDVGDRAADFRFWSATALGSSAPRSTQS